MSATSTPVKSRREPGDRIVLLVGDVGCGKTTIINALKLDPSEPDNFREVELDDESIVRLEFIEAPCQPEYSAIRTLAYPKASTVLLCFHGVKFGSLISVQKYWFKEVRQHNEDVPVLLVSMDGWFTVHECREKLEIVRYFFMDENGTVGKKVPELLKAIAESANDYW